MTNKEKFLVGRPFIYNEEPNLNLTFMEIIKTHSVSRTEPTSLFERMVKIETGERTRSLDNHMCNISRIGSTFIDVYQFWFGRKQTIRLHFAKMNFDLPKEIIENNSN